MSWLFIQNITNIYDCLCNVFGYKFFIMCSDEEIRKRVADNTKNYRKKQKLTQEMLSEKSGVSVNTIRNMEKGRWPSSSTIAAVSKVFGIDPKMMLASPADNYILKEEITTLFLNSLNNQTEEKSYSFNHFENRSKK